MEYYARSTNGKPPYQPLSVHLSEAARLTAEYCKDFTDPKIGEICGQYHDIGKYSKTFQKRIRGETVRTDHSTACAKLFYDYAQTCVSDPVSKITYTLLAYITAGHHTGLPDFGNANADETTLVQRLQKCDPDKTAAWKTELPTNLPPLTEIIQNQKLSTSPGFFFFLYTHFLYSALIDADRTSAANFPIPQKPPHYPDLAYYLSELENHLESLTTGKTGELNTIRNHILQTCRNAGRTKPGMFTLTVPTGGGKTLSSLAFALRHAIHNNQKRIIYTIPFTSIIEQNAQVYKNIFGEENVIEHHSNFILPNTSENKTYDEEKQENTSLRLAVSNWNAPLILTTNVQFFESLFTANPSRSRKVHNIANSVIILDEVQTLPNQLLRPCLEALSELVRNYHCSVILCTATQPGFEENNLISKDIDVRNIINDYPKLAEKMKRANAQYIGRQNLSRTADLLLKEKQVLCIVNTKKHARDLFNEIQKNGNCFHLSTNMYPAHRKKIISEIRRKLKAGENCRVISTQLIEAGVDIDFPTVYRSLSGVDSIIQAAGRCNREGILESGSIYIFEPEENTYIPSGYLKQTADITSVFKNDLDLLSSDAVKRYFHDLFTYRSDEMDKTDILKICRRAQETGFTDYPFREISDTFKMIEDSGNAVIIPTPEAQRILAKLNENNLSQILKEITPYCVNIREKDLDTLCKAGKIRIEHDTLAVLASLDDYDKDTGLRITEDINKNFYCY